MTTRGPQSRFAALDIMRMLGVTLVVLAHVLGPRDGGRHEVFGLYVFSMGGTGVTILLVLSGMGLEYSYAKRQLHYPQFIRKRFERIYPTYWISIMITIALLGSNRINQGFPTLLLDLSGFLVFTGLLWSNYILPTGWFIGLILALYALYPIVSKLVKNRPHTSLVLILVLSVMSRYMLASAGFETDARDWFPLARLFEFTLGIWIVANQPIFKYITNIGAGINRTQIGAIIKHGSDLSFPVYLIHWAALRTPYNQNKLVLAMAITLIASEVILITDRWATRSLRSRRRTEESVQTAIDIPDLIETPEVVGKQGPPDK